MLEREIYQEKKKLAIILLQFEEKYKYHVVPDIAERMRIGQIDTNEYKVSTLEKRKFYRENNIEYHTNNVYLIEF
jgi:hypothetical protein